MIAAFVMLGIFGGMNNIIPQKSRWLSTAVCLAALLAGMMLHSILPRVWAKAFGEWHIPRAVGEEDDFHRMVRSKVYRAKLWLLSDSTKWRNLVYSLCSSPCDHLTLVLQHLEIDGGILLRLVTPGKNIFLHCLQDYTAMLLESDCKVVALMKYHFAPLGCEAVHAAIAFAFSVALQLSCQVWKMMMRYLSWPYCLAVLVAPGISAAARRLLADELFDVAKECCLDDDFSLKVAVALSCTWQTRASPENPNRMDYRSSFVFGS